MTLTVHMHSEHICTISHEPLPAGVRNSSVTILALKKSLLTDTAYTLFSTRAVRMAKLSAATVSWG